MTSSQLLIIAPNDSLYFENHPKQVVDRIKELFGVRSICLCTGEDCIPSVAGQSRAILYFNSSHISYNEVCEIASAQWNAPRVLGVKEAGMDVRVYAGEYTSPWYPKEKLYECIEDGIKHYQEPVLDKHLPAITLAGVCLLVLMLMLHMCVYASATKPFNSEPPIQVNNDIATSNCP